MTSPDLFQPKQPGRLEDIKPTIGGLANIMLSNIGTIAQNIFKGIADALGGLFGGQSGPLGQISDGQVDLIDQVELISPLLDYGAVSTPPGGGDIMHGSGRIPFSYAIGAHRGVTLEDNSIRLDDIGVWDLRCQVTTSWTGNPLAQDVKVWLQVLRPDNTVFSQQAHYVSTMKSVTVPIVTAVMVKETGYRVVVWVWTQDGNRGWWRGPEWTRLIAQHITRDTTGGTGGETSAPGEDNPDPVEEPSEPGEGENP